VQSSGKGKRTMGKSITYRMVEHDPGGFSVPAKAKNTGQFDLDLEKGRNTFHYDGTREKLGGSMAGWAVVTEPLVVHGGQPAVRVTMSLRTKPETAPRRFVLLGTNKAEFDSVLAAMRPALYAQEGEISKVVAAKSSGQWWAGLGKVAMTKVLYGGRDGILKVEPNEGVHWSPGLGKTKIPFGAIAKIEIGEVTKQHGRQHSAIGFGGVGLAVVAATALHNHRAARPDTFHVFAVTTKDAKVYQFSTQKALSPLAPLYEAYHKASAPSAPAAAAPRPAVAPSPPALAVEAAMFELIDYDGALPSRLQPEAKGTLVFPGSGSTVARWELHWATGSDLAIEHPLTHGSLVRYPITVEATGPTSCRASIRDTQNTLLIAHFDLPTTAATAVEAALFARESVVAQGRLAIEREKSRKPLPAAPPPAPSHLGVADELAKLADLNEKGVLSDEEFTSQKAKLLSQ
jgi:hypothetical protein